MVDITAFFFNDWSQLAKRHDGCLTVWRRNRIDPAVATGNAKDLPVAVKAKLGLRSDIIRSTTEGRMFMKKKAAIIVMSDPKAGSEEALGRLFNALAAVYDFKQRGDEVTLLFQGA